MTKIRLKTKIISALITELEDLPKLEWSKVWSAEAKTIGLFTYEVQQGQYIGVVNVIVEHDSDSMDGTVWILTYGSPFSPLETVSRHTLETVGKIALSNKWEFEVLPPSYRGEKCPHCQAVYVYSDSDLTDHGTLACQNCGKEFRSDIQSREGVDPEEALPGSVKCPYCSISYVYKARHLRDDGTVSCQNCGRIFPFPIDDMTKYSQHFYADQNEQ